MANTPHTGGATISGTTTENQVLTANTATLADADGLGTLHYQWQRDGGSGFVNVGADQPTYTLGDADVGEIVRVVVSYLDGNGTAESATSPVSAAIAGVNDPHTGGAAITGTATEDHVLTAFSTLADVDGLGTLHYQWQHDVGSGFVNVGADQATYTLGDSDVGGIVRVVISYTDGQGFGESANSASTAGVLSSDPHTGGVTIAGSTIENQVLTANTATLADADGLGTLHYQWQRDTGSGFVNVGADQPTYTLGDADIGGIVRVVVSYTDGNGTAESATSPVSAAIGGVNDPHTGGATIAGTATEDQVLTAVSTLADVDGLGALHYQWQRNVSGGFVNVGADQATYMLGDGDVGGIVRVVISYTDSQGFAESATSASTAGIANVNDPHTGGATVTGTAVKNQVLTANTATLADADGLGTLHYQWRRDVGSGFVNVGLDQATYTLGNGDVGGVVQVVVSYTDGQGTAESVVSAATAVIANVNAPHTGGVTIAGTTTENQVLTANTATLVDPDVLGTLHYQWQRDSGSGFVNVGTDQATYTLGDTDVGGIVRVVVSYTDGLGFIEAATSAASAAIAAVNDPHTGGVSISGTATEDQLLTAISALADVDGLGTLHFQWQRDVGSGYVNVGTDRATYTPGDSDVGGTVRVVVSYTDGQGFSESATSAGTAAIANVNDAPVNEKPASLNIAANTNVAIAGLGVSDVDTTSLTTTLHVEHGTLIVGAAGGAMVAGSGSSTVTLTGTVAEIDAALGAANNVLYHGAFDFSGIEHLTMTSNDGTLSDTDVLNLGVFRQIAAMEIYGITRPALTLDSSGHIILDAATSEFVALYGSKLLYAGVPEGTLFPPVAAPSDFHLV